MSINKLEMKISQLSRQMGVQASLSGGFIGNTVENSKNESCKVIELRNRVVPSKPKVSKEKKKSREVGKRISN